MKFNIKSLKIRNFKGIKEQDITFDDIETTICGENGTGKTTVVDAFNWLLFEKDSKGRSQFEIKTLEDGKVIHGLDHMVEGIFKIDGRDLKLRKIYKEIWTLRKGDTQETFTGHEIERFVNDVPVKKTEYEKKINELIDEKIFQLLTDPLHFSQGLHWKDRREALFELAGGQISKEQIISGNPRLRLIEEDLEDKTIEELRQTLRYQRRELNKEREHIPVQISTLSGTIKEVNKESVSQEIKEIKNSIEEIEGQMLDATKISEQKLEKQDEFYKLRSKQNEIEYETKINAKDPDDEFRKQINEFGTKLKELSVTADGEIRVIEMLENNLERGNAKLEKLRNDYKAEAAKKLEIDENINTCPTCERPFEEEEVKDKITELEENFKGNQVRELKRLREEGQSMSQEVSQYQEELDQVKAKLEETQDQMETLGTAIRDRESMLGVNEKIDIQSLLAENAEYQEIRSRIEKLAAELQDKAPETEIENLRTRKRELEEKLKELEREIHQEDINKETKEKMDKLMIREKELSSEISKVEKKENVADEYVTTQAKLIEKNINEKFKEVSFRLFKEQTNGGLDPTCEVLVDGVPFDNANTAGQVNAGLDVINSLCKHYDTYTPIFIDNRESINDLIDTDSQLINLKVTRHKTLRIEQK